MKITNQEITTLELLLNKLSQPQTWRGIVLALTGAGIALKPSQVAAITSVGLAVVGIINVIWKAPATHSDVAQAIQENNATQQNGVVGEPLILTQNIPEKSDKP